MMREEILRTINSIERALIADQFPNYIDYIRFPFYKNLQKESRIDFEFPFTVLTGLNGSGKSSALHAIYGAPEGYSTGKYWFSTFVDPISQKRGNPPAFVYGYKNVERQVVEVLKTRVGTAKGKDYWEPARPVKKYGMLLMRRARNPTIPKEVLYLDFRSELSAFDKYFYFGNFSSTVLHRTKQDVLRKYSRHVKTALDNKEAIRVRKRKTDKPISLSNENLTDISAILGKSYEECKYLVHDLYGFEGSTVYFKTTNVNYSEAFAGRGEFAVVKLVYEIEKAVVGSLVVLDEPEVSLHPGAQEQLKLFLLKKCLAKKLQIVVSTHSPKLVEFLPDNAIKLFYQETDGKFAIKNSCSYFEAFESIGIEINDQNKKTIIIEDTIAKTIIDAVIKDLGDDFSLRLSTKFYPGGAKDIYKRAVGYAEEAETNKFILLDGDQKKPVHDPSNFTAAESGDLNFINEKLVEETGIQFTNLGFIIDGNVQGGNPEQKRIVALKYLTYLKTNLDYLPCNVPEQIIWDEEFANNMLSTLEEEMPDGIIDFKKKFREFARLQMGSAEAVNIQSTHKMFIKDFIRRKDGNYEAIVDILRRFRNA